MEQQELVGEVVMCIDTRKDKDGKPKVMKPGEVPQVGFVFHFPGFESATYWEKNLAVADKMMEQVNKDRAEGKNTNFVLSGFALLPCTHTEQKPDGTGLITIRDKTPKGFLSSTLAADVGAKPVIALAEATSTTVEVLL